MDLCQSIAARKMKLAVLKRSFRSYEPRRPAALRWINLSPSRQTEDKLCIAARFPMSQPEGMQQQKQFKHLSALLFRMTDISRIYLSFLRYYVLLAFLPFAFDL